MSNFSHRLNVVAQCREWHVPLFSCPQFLFIVMGVVIITAMVGTNIVARYYADPDVAAIVVLFVAAFLFVIGYIITNAFERMAQTTRAKAEFVNIISHQLRSPLTSIRWRLEKLLSQRVIEKEARRDLAIIYRAEEHIMRMVNTMLEVNRIEEKALVFDKHIFAFRHFVFRIMEEFKINAEEKKITLVFKESNEKEEFPVLADSIRIRWVVENLIDNALRYSGEGTTITVSLLRKGKDIIMNVHDQGIGISKETRRRLFTRFFRADEHRLTTEGSGLGLYIAKAIIEAHGGTIGVDSPPQKGSTFWFTLPLAS